MIILSFFSVIRVYVIRRGALQGIQVLKVDSKSSRTVCYVTPLTQRQAPSPADFSSFSHFDVSL